MSDWRRKVRLEKKSKTGIVSQTGEVSKTGEEKSD
jgi:hypothetical protein